MIHAFMVVDITNHFIIIWMGQINEKARKEEYNT